MTRNPACAICGRDDKPIHLTEWDNRRTVPACDDCDPTEEIPTPPQPLTFAERVYNWIRRNPDCTFADVCDGMEMPDWSEGEEAAKQRDVVMQRIAYMVRQGRITQSEGRPKMFRVTGDEAVPARFGAEPKPKKTRQARFYHRAVKAGICPRCGEAAAPGKAYCASCIEKRKRSAKDVPEGQCHLCRCVMLEEWRRYKNCPPCRERRSGNARELRKDLSDEARERIRQASKAKREKLKAEGKCYWCQEPATASYCTECAKIHRERLRLRRRASFSKERQGYACRRCGQQGHNTRTCRAVAEPMKEAA